MVSSNADGRTAFVTGANGHIGSNLCRALGARGVRVAGLVRPGADLRSLAGVDIERVEGDVLHPQGWREAAREADWIFHAAAVYSTDPARASEITRVALDGTRAVFEAARSSERLERLVMTSSVAAIGHNYDPGRVLDESSWNAAPMDAYCAAKTDAERLGWRLAQENGINTVAVNPATVLGPHDHRPTPSNLIVSTYLQRPPPVSFAGGHCYVDVEDVAAGHVQAAERGRPGERYILGGDNVDLDELFTRLSTLTGLPRPRVRLGRLAFQAAAGALVAKSWLLGGRPLLTPSKARKIHGYFSYFSSKKAQAELGYSWRPIEDTLERVVAWFVQTPGLLPPRRADEIRRKLLETQRAAPELRSA